MQPAAEQEMTITLVFAEKTGSPLDSEAQKEAAQTLSPEVYLRGRGVSSTTPKQKVHWIINWIN